MFTTHTATGAAVRDQAGRDRLGHDGANDGANGSAVNGRLSGLGYSQWAENIAEFQSAQAAVNFWSTSPGHRATIRNLRVQRDWLGGGSE